MDQNYLQQLIDEVKQRNGGLILNMDGKPEAVVLSIEKYNEIVASNKPQASGENNSSQPSLTLGEGDIFHPKTVLVTGGAGYIGAHIARQLINAGHRVLVIDNLSTGKIDNIAPQAKFIEGDLGDINLLRDVFASEKIDVVMHLAALIEVEESVREPVKYLENNCMNTAKLLCAMDEANVRNIIFSSTAAVYGEQQEALAETYKTRPNNPYGHSKLLAEKIIKYYCEHKNFKAVIFRYFNACGSDFDGKIQATHESHLVAKLLLVVSGAEEELTVNGSDYETVDGTCVRDYVHVLDIAEAHLLAMNNINALTGHNIYNIGTGRGVSVLEMVNSAAEILNKMIPMRLGPKRPGDAPISVADASKIRQELGFKAKFSDLETIIKTAYIQNQNYKI